MIAILMILIGQLVTVPIQRNQEIATAIASAVAEDGPLETLDAEHTGTLLVAFADEESAFREEVQDCRKRGKLGEVGLPQLLPGPNWEGHTRKEICSDLKLQFVLALHVLKRAEQSSQRPRGTGPFVTYLARAWCSGGALTDTRQSRARVYTYRRLAEVLKRTVAGNYPGIGYAGWL